MVGLKRGGAKAPPQAETDQIIQRLLAGEEVFLKAQRVTYALSRFKKQRHLYVRWRRNSAIRYGDWYPLNHGWTIRTVNSCLCSDCVPAEYAEKAFITQATTVINAIFAGLDVAALTCGKHIP